MKTIFILLGLICSISLKSQTSIITSTVSVRGNCGECKERIENAVDIKGVKTSSWDEKTQTLSVTYDTKKVTLLKIEKAIAKAGHKTTTQNADSVSYKALPSCCKYEAGDCKKK